MKTKVPAAFELRTFVSVDQSYIHCNTEVDTKIWQCKPFQNCLKSPCFDELA